MKFPWHLASSWRRLLAWGPRKGDIWQTMSQAMTIQIVSSSTSSPWRLPSRMPSARCVCSLEWWMGFHLVFWWSDLCRWILLMCANSWVITLRLGSKTRNCVLTWWLSWWIWWDCHSICGLAKPKSQRIALSEQETTRRRLGLAPFQLEWNMDTLWRSLSVFPSSLFRGHQRTARASCLYLEGTTLCWPWSLRATSLGLEMSSTRQSMPPQAPI